jgi:iron(III) transport system ATP-binding protein
VIDADIRLKLENISKVFPERRGKGNVYAVDDVSLDIYAGEFLTLLGPSGCGKTTTLRLIAGFESPSSGRILLNHEDITFQPPNKRDMALVFQSYALFPHMSVFENVAYGLETGKIPRKNIHLKVEETLNTMGLQNMADRRPNQLSGGQQQRVALARSLIMEPSVLLFDEPLSNLDAKLRMQMRSEIHRLQRSLAITSVYVTHDQVEAMALSDRIVVMNKGRIEQIGSPEEIYRYPSTRFVADFIGRANFIQTRVTSTQDNCVTVAILGQTIELKPQKMPSSSDVIVMLRPEGLSLEENPSLKQVKIIQTMYLGSEIEYVVEADNQHLIVVENDPRASRIFAEGQTLGINFIPEAVHLLLDETS